MLRQKLLYSRNNYHFSTQTSHICGNHNAIILAVNAIFCKIFSVF